MMRLTRPSGQSAARFKLRALAVAAVLLIGACSSSVPPSRPKDNARLTPATRMTRDLMRLPLPRVRLPVAVYAFRDQTGHYRPSPESIYSTSVSQGAASMLVMALKESGWYQPVEREGLQNLLTERRIVRAIESPSDKGKPAIPLPNLTPASLLIEGGIVGYESNVRTGGKGAHYLGIGASTQYRVDQVTVVLRSIDIKNGQLLNSVSATKTIFSYQFSSTVYKFVDFKELLQAEAGYTTNEPAQLALREAIELAVLQLTVDGIRDRHLELRNSEDWFSPVLQTYASADAMNVAEEASIDRDFVPMRPRESDRPREGAGRTATPVGPASRPAAEAPTPPAATAPAVAAPVVVAPVVVAPQPADPAPARPVPQPPRPPVDPVPAAATVTSSPRPEPEPVRAQPAGRPLAAPNAADDIFESYWRKR